MMARCYVLQGDDGWMIRFGDQTSGPYPTREQALLSAIEAARHGGARHEAAVLVEDIKDHFLTKWSYGEPPHVPLA